MMLNYKYKKTYRTCNDQYNSALTFSVTKIKNVYTPNPTAKVNMRIKQRKVSLKMFYVFFQIERTINKRS